MHTHAVALIHQRIASDDTKPVDTRLNVILQSACELLRLDVAIISQIDRKNKTYTIAHTFTKGTAIHMGRAFPLEVNFCALTLHLQEPVMLHNTASLPKLRHSCHEVITVKAYIGVPISVNGVPFGTLNFCGKTGRAPFTDNDHVLLLHLAVLTGQLMAEKAKTSLHVDSTKETTTAPIIRLSPAQSSV